MSDIKLFRLNENANANAAAEITGAAAALERGLQRLIENNLETFFGVRFLASEFSTSDGRMDTLGLDENNCPVIIEYKRHASGNIINQGLFYMDWLMDHKASFELLVLNKISKDVAYDIDWSAPRLLCVAADFTRYDEHAIKQMNRNIELIRYRKFGADLLMLDLLTATTRKTQVQSSEPSQSSGSSMPLSQREHNEIIAAATGSQKERFEALRDFLNDLGDDVQERPLKYYVAFKRIKNFACVQLQRSNILIFVKLDLDEKEFISGFTRDVSDIGHYGTGNVEIAVSSDADLERAKPLIQKSYEAS